MFGAVVGLLAAIGTYAVPAYAVMERAREFGIRVALEQSRAAFLRSPERAKTVIRPTIPQILPFQPPRLCIGDGTIECSSESREGSMVWFFARGNEAVRVETRFDNASGEYVLEVGWANRQLETERFRDHSAFEARVASVEARLRVEAWAQVGGPEILRDGWRGPFTN